jgi:hypothetical protein
VVVEGQRSPSKLAEVEAVVQCDLHQDLQQQQQKHPWSG